MCVSRFCFVRALRGGVFGCIGLGRGLWVLVLQIFFRAILSAIYESYYIGSC